METAPLKSFATWARAELISEVGARLAAVLAPASPERIENPETVRSLESAIEEAGGGDIGRRAVTDRVAYTWFNRIIALRFMDANGYTTAGIVSPEHGQSVGQPEILADAKRGVFDPDVVSEQAQAAVMQLLDGRRPSNDPQGEAYQVLLAEYCNYWNLSMPFMFERAGGYTDLLIPANLLADDSLLDRTVETMTPEVCRDVEVIGWLYQFYISEKKDEVFAGFKKNKKAGADEIPAATQLFTPDWIVRYLVENSVGRLWMLNHPSSRLVDQMEYYIEPVDEETEFLKISSPEELKIIDPACGSGHMLTYSFDLLYAIYEEEGYAPSEIPSLILTHNLYGTEIDQRAGALAAFALTMKARAKQRTFFSRDVEPNICVLEPISFTRAELELLRPQTLASTDLAFSTHREIDAFWNQFEHADTFGSLIRPNADLIQPLRDHLETLDKDRLGAPELRENAERVLKQALFLTRRYDVAIANPPYMGSKQMNALLSQFLKKRYPNSKSDLFAAFIERCTDLAVPGGAIAMITMQSWMFLSSYEKLRKSLLEKQHISSMLHLGARAFDSIGGEVVSSTAFVLINRLVDGTSDEASEGVYIRLVEGSSEQEKMDALVRALSAQTREANFYLASSSDFATVPGSPIVYWLSANMWRTFSLGSPLGEVALPLVGLRTGDNARFMRQWWEVSRSRTAFDCESLQAAETSGSRWFPYNKGGAFRRWYGNQEFVVNWENDGRQIEEGLAQRYPYLVPAGKSLVRGQGREHYFSPSVSWSDVSSGAPSFRLFPPGFIHGNKGNSLFGEAQLLRHLSAVLNSTCVTQMLEALTPTMTASVGDVAKVPVPEAIADLQPSITRALVETAKSDFDESETSWNFDSSPLIAAFQRSGPASG